MTTATDAAGYSLLVVEDEVGLRRSVADYFTDSGFRVCEAGSGRDGLDLFRAEQPDIVFTDLRMPGGNGMELIAAIRSESPLTPIIVISGAGMIDDAVTAMKQGACDYLCKPIRDMAVLERLARREVGRFRQQQGMAVAGKDPLTGLPDRSRLEQLFQEMVADCTGITLVLVDLDSFKAIKEVFGQAFADRLLMEIGERLSRLAPADSLVHLGSDEFALLLATSDGTSVDMRVAAVQEAVARPFRMGQDELTVTASMGLAVYPHDGSCGNDLRKHAATALFKAKKSGKNRVQRYCRTIPTNSERFMLQARLRRAFELQEFSLLYQPQYDLEHGELHGIEALLRWHTDLGQGVAPALFIPALEETGLIIPVGEWVLREACTCYREWRALGFPPRMLSVNVSAVQFHSSGFVDTVQRVLLETGMPPNLLCLELTESVVMRDCEETIATLSALKELGIELSLDDFGTGYSSLSYLSRMPLDELKIDRSFTAALPHSTSNASIVETVIGMAACMKLRVVAEGVEHEQQLTFLREKQCRIVQGFYFSRPLTRVGVIDAFIRKPAAGR